MTQSVKERAVFSFPEKPFSSKPLAIAREIGAIICHHIPYSIDKGFYRLERATEERGGNCYAQTLGVIAVAKAWGFPSAVVLDPVHAQAAAVIKDQLLFIDPTEKAARATYEAAENRSEPASFGFLRDLYEAYLPEEVASGHSIRYFFKDNGTTWRTASAVTLTEPVVPAHATYPHVVVDAWRGEKMLHAIGDSYRLGYRKPFEFLNRYHELAPHIPDIIELPSPAEVKAGIIGDSNG